MGISARGGWFLVGGGLGGTAGFAFGAGWPGVADSGGRRGCGVRRAVLWVQSGVAGAGCVRRRVLSAGGVSRARLGAQDDGICGGGGKVGGDSRASSGSGAGECCGVAGVPEAGVRGARQYVFIEMDCAGFFQAAGAERTLKGILNRELRQGRPKGAEKTLGNTG